MKRLIIYLGISFVLNSLPAQQLGRLVLGNGGTQSQAGGIQLSYLVGEAITGTLPSPNLILTQGFQQPQGPQASFPVEWLSFSATQLGLNVQLDWLTGQERNSDYFEVQRSGDGNNFLAIGALSASGNSDEIQTYGFLDQSLSAQETSTLYYRLRQVDLDGSFRYSPLVSVQFVPNQTLHLQVIPNPVQDQAQVSYQWNLPQEGRLRFWDPNGKIIWQRSLPNQSGQFPLAVKHLSPGVYLLELIAREERKVVRVLVR
jgi:hypothetical protein